MKKYLIFSILSLIFITALPVGAVKTINVNPINLAIIIVEKTDSVKIQRELDYYGYTLQGTEDGYKIMRNTNGNEIRYSLPASKIEGNFPTVIVKNRETPKGLDSRLGELRFQKMNNGYQRLSSKDDLHIIHCTPGPSNTLIFQIHQK